MDAKTAKRLRFIVNTVFVALIIALVYVALKYVAGMILPLLLAFAIVAAARPIAARLFAGAKIKHEIASVLVVAMLYILIGGLLLLLVAGFISAVRQGLPMLPVYYRSAVAPALESLGEAYSRFAASLPEQLRVPPELWGALSPTLQNLFDSFSSGGLGWLSGLTAGAPSFLLTVLFTVMLSFFLSLRYDETAAFLDAAMPPKTARILREARICLFDAVLKYLTAAFTLMAITFCELSVGLLLLGRKNAFVTAAAIAVLDALPVFGSGAALFPWAAVELIRGNHFFGVGLLVLWGILAFVRSILEPKIVGDRLGLNPVVSLTAIFIGYKVFGFTGMFLMPVLTQITLTLYKNGSFKRFSE